jgi:hypothetical protein
MASAPADFDAEKADNLEDVSIRSAMKAYT